MLEVMEVMDMKAEVILEVMEVMKVDQSVTITKHFC